jgi:hypothetical protein
MNIPPLGQTAKVPVPGTNSEVNVRVYTNDYVGNMQYVFDENAKLVMDATENRNWDCLRQLVGAVFFGIFFFPFAATRLIGHVTSCIDPMRVNLMKRNDDDNSGEGCVIPGLEYCSSNCGCTNRGYEHNNYTQKQNNGSGFSRRTLDIINVIVTPITVGAVIAVYSMNELNRTNSTLPNF